MSTDIICDESELSIAATRINEYSEFLEEIITKYITILSDIQEKGIKDELICSKLTEIKNSLTPYRKLIKMECKDSSSDIRKYMSAVSDSDNFKFPDEITAIVATILSQLS